ncbi:MAG: type I restriction endonuclease, partial [Bacteroidota bacterium]
MNTRPIINAHFDEARQSQLPLVELLINMGYTYLPRAEVLRERHEDTSKFILKDIAFEALRRINSYEHSGQMWKFEDEEIKKAIDELEAIKFVGLVDTSKEIYNTIMPTTGGKTIKVFHEGKSESKSFRFIDFAKPENNTFHVVVEFEATGKQNIRPDIVLFVNGIPFVIVENKKAGVDIAEAMTQHVRNQKADHCPRLYIYTQMLVATNGTDFRYGTTDTPAKFYVEWKEKDVNEIDRYTTNKEIYE